MKLATRIVRGLGRAFALLPMPLALGAGALVGRAAWWLMPVRRRVACRNIEACFPELAPKERRTLARRSMIAIGQGLSESILAWHGDSRRWAQRHRIEGLEHLVADERPRLVLMAHFACCELACRMLNEALPEPAPVVVRRHQQAWFEAWVDEGRRGYAGETIAKKNLRRMLKLLKGGGRLLYGPDQNFTYQSVFAPFFGIPAATLTATADLAARSGAVVVPAWGYRDRGPRYRLIVEAPWEDFPSGDPEADAARINRWMEEKIRAAPEQYLWLHRRFRSRPAGEPPFYAREARRRKHR